MGCETGHSMVEAGEACSVIFCETMRLSFSFNIDVGKLRPTTRETSVMEALRSGLISNQRQHPSYFISVVRPQSFVLLYAR